MLALASDFDNTLYFMWEEAHFKDDDLEAIRKFREAGNLFGVCTGRSWRGITDVTDGVLDLDFYILESGSLILDGNQNVLFKKCLSRAAMTRRSCILRGSFPFGMPSSGKMSIQAGRVSPFSVFKLRTWMLSSSMRGK